MTKVITIEIDNVNNIDDDHDNNGDDNYYNKNNNNTLGWIYHNYNH